MTAVLLTGLAGLAAIGAVYLIHTRGAGLRPLAARARRASPLTRKGAHHRPRKTPTGDQS